MSEKYICTSGMIMIMIIYTLIILVYYTELYQYLISGKGNNTSIPFLCDLLWLVTSRMLNRPNVVVMFCKV